MRINRGSFHRSYPFLANGEHKTKTGWDKKGAAGVVKAATRSEVRSKYKQIS